MPGRPAQPPGDPRRPPQPPRIVVRLPTAPEPPGPKPPEPKAAPETPGALYREVRVFRWTMSVLALVLTAGGLLVTVVSLVVLFAAIRRYGLAENARGAWLFHDSNRPTAALKEIEDTLWWDSTYHPARELAATIHVEAGSFDRAESTYRALLQAGHRTPSVFAGMGALAIRRADREKDSARMAALIEQARESYQKAAGSLEGEIGLALVEVFRAKRLNEPGRLAEAKARLAGVAKKLEDGAGGRRICRGPLADFYAAYGLCLAMLGESLPEAAAWCRRAAHVRPRWDAPEENLAFVLARSWWEQPPSYQEFERRRQEFERTLHDMREKVTNRRAYPDLVRPWSRLTVAGARLFARHRDFGTYQRHMDGLGFEGVDPAFVRKARLAIWWVVFDPAYMSLSDSDLHRYVKRAVEEVANDPALDTPQQAPLRAVALNNLAAILEYITVRAGGDPLGGYLRVRETLEKAAALDPGNPAVWRNLAVIGARIVRRAGDPAFRRQSLEKLRADLDKARGLAPDDPLLRKIEAEIGR